MKKCLLVILLLVTITYCQSAVRIIYYIREYLDKGFNANYIDVMRVDSIVVDNINADTIYSDSMSCEALYVSDDALVNDKLVVQDTFYSDFIAPDDSSIIRLAYSLLDSIGATKLKGAITGNDQNVTGLNKVSGDTIDITYGIIDTIANQIYFKDTIASNIISKGSVYGKYVIYNALPTSQLTCASGSSSATFFNFVGSTTDSIVIDSMKCVFVTDHNDVYLDSMVIYQGYRNDGIKIGTADILYCNVTDYGAGNTDTLQVTYSGINITLSTTWKPRARIVGATSGAAGSVECYTGILYCHYK